jgi:hypothetical protein
MKKMNSTFVSDTLDSVWLCMALLLEKRMNSGFSSKGAGPDSKRARIHVNLVLL